MYQPLSFRFSVRSKETIGQVDKASHSLLYSVHQNECDLLLQIMVWGGERHGRCLQDFTNAWKEPAHEQ